MSKYKAGDICILDTSNILNLKEYSPLKVRVLKKLFAKDKYICEAIEPVVYPCVKDGFAVRQFSISGKYLSPSSLREKVVIRYPTNMPRFSKNDIMALDDIIMNQKLSLDEIYELRSIATKIRYYMQFNEVEL